MSRIKVWWHCRKNKGHKMASYETVIGFKSFYCQTCMYGLPPYIGK